MCFTILTSASVWTLDKLDKFKNRTVIILADPGVFLSASIGGAIARSMVLPVDTGRFGPIQAVYRKAPQWGVMMWVYVPIASKQVAQRETPSGKLFTTYFTAFFAGCLMRLLTNPFSNIRENITPDRKSFALSAAHIAKEKGVLGFFMRQHPIIANGVLYGLTLTFFEAFRNFADNHGAPMDNPLSNAACNGLIGVAASTAGCALSFPFSKLRYEATLARESAVTRGFLSAVVKEAPQFGILMFTFSMLMPVLAPHHGKRCGFGH